MQIEGIDPYSTYIPAQSPPPEETEQTPPPEEYVEDESVGNTVDTTA